MKCDCLPGDGLLIFHQSPRPARGINTPHRVLLLQKPPTILTITITIRITMTARVSIFLLLALAAAATVSAAPRRVTHTPWCAYLGGQVRPLHLLPAYLNIYYYISTFLITYIYKTSIPGDTHGPRSGHLYSRIHRHPVWGHLQEGARWGHIFLFFQKYFYSNENIFRRCLRGSARPQVGSGWPVAGPVRAVCRGSSVQRL